MPIILLGKTVNGVTVALLRGINLGGRNKLAMKDLADFFTEAGCDEVRTYIQSGNVVFRSGRLAGKVADVVRARIAAEFGYAIPIVLRTASELEGIVRNNPYLQTGAAENTLHTVFLAEQPSPSAIASLDPNRSPNDSFLVRGREIYLCTPKGFGNCRLTNAWFDSRLSTVSTVRNWRTCLNLHDATKQFHAGC